MTENETTEGRSNVVPLLLAALVCDSAFQDPATGKTSLIGIFDRIHARKFPAAHGLLNLFIRLTDAEGNYDLQVKFIRLSTGDVLATGQGPLTVRDRLAGVSLILAFQGVPLPEPGRYEFQIWANSAYLGSASLDARILPQENQNV